MEIKDCPEKLQKMINELKKEYLEVLDYFLEHACNLPSEQRICWHKIRRVLDGKEKVTTIKELSSYEDLLCNMRNFLEKKAKTRQNRLKKRGIASVVNTVPILVTDSEDETIIHPSTSKETEIPFKISKWSSPVPLSDINDHPVAVEVVRNSTLVAQFPSPVEPEIISRLPLSLNELFVAQHNFKERPPPILLENHQNEKSNRYSKNKKRRISHYHDKQQPQQSSTQAKKTQESYSDHKLRREAERLANNRKLQHTTVSSESIQHRYDEPSTSSGSNMVADLGEISSKFLENFVPTNRQSINNEPVEKPPPQLINYDDNFFGAMMPLIDEDVINPIQIKQENVFEQPVEDMSREICPDEESSRGESPEENVNNESKFFIKQEPKEFFSYVDENTADYTEFINQLVKEEPLDL